MSCEIILARTYLPGLDKLLDEDGDLEPLVKAEFEIIMKGAPVYKRQEDNSCWLEHPSGVAWLAAKFHEGKNEEGERDPRRSYISFSISYAHNQFLKVWADACELALRLAAYLNARVFEDTEYLELTRENADELLAPESDLVRKQAAFWKSTISGLDSRMQAPLEIPIGSYDAVNDYFVFFLDPKQKTTMPELIKRLELNADPESIASDRFALMESGSDSLLSRVLLRPNDQALQIWPFYWLEPFSKVAKATFDLALLMQKELGGELFLKEKKLTEELAGEIESRIQGLGVEFFLWLESYGK